MEISFTEWATLNKYIIYLNILYHRFLVELEILIGKL